MTKRVDAPIKLNSRTVAAKRRRLITTLQRSAQWHQLAGTPPAFTCLGAHTGQPYVVTCGQATVQLDQVTLEPGARSVTVERLAACPYADLVFLEERRVSLGDHVIGY